MIKTAQATNKLPTDGNKKIVDMPMAGCLHLTEHGTAEGATDSHKNWKVVCGALTYEGTIYVPQHLRSQVICLFHDNHESGNFESPRTAEHAPRDLYWPAVDAMVRKYFAGNKVHHRFHAPCYAQHGPNIPLPPPHQPGEGVTTDFVNTLPESMALAYNRSLVIVDQLPEMAIYLPCRKDIHSPELAGMFFEHVICKQGVLDNIITEHGTQFTRPFCNRVCSHMSINHCLLTAFHPKTDVQPERQNQTMEQYLRAFCNYKPENWVELLPFAEFAYNNSVNASTRMTLFWAV